MIVLLQRWWLPRWSVSREVSLSAFSVWFRLCGIYLLLVTRWAFNLVKISFGLYFHWLRWPIDRVWSCKQAQKLHVCAIVRRAVTCCLTVSFSFFCRLLSMNCSHISFVSPKHSSLNLFTTICVTWNFLKKNVFVYTFWGARWWDGGGVGSAWSLLLSTSFQPLWLSYFLCILVLSTSHMIMMYHYHTVLFETVASHCIVSLCIVSHCIVWDCML